MPVIHIDQKTIATLPTPNLYWDDELRGFGYRIHADKHGKLRCAYIIQFRIKGTTKQRKVTIGDAAKINARQAQCLPRSPSAAIQRARRTTRHRGSRSVAP